MLNLWLDRRMFPVVSSASSHYKEVAGTGARGATAPNQDLEPRTAAVKRTLPEDDIGQPGRRVEEQEVGGIVPGGGGESQGTLPTAAEEQTKVEVGVTGNMPKD